MQHYGSFFSQLGERFQQRFGTLQVGRIKSFGEPGVDGGEKFLSFSLLALLLP